MVVQVWGIVSLVFFYLLIVVIGFVASRKTRTEDDEARDDVSISEDVMLAGKDLGIAIGMFSMTATWVDGGFISGAAESVYKDGVLWCQGPLGYSLALILAGKFYATKMYDQGYVTMLDPFQKIYGKWAALLVYLPSACGDIICNGAILSSLGATVSTIVGMDVNISIITSGVIATLYTIAGGMYSVTYTDVVELVLIFCSVWLCIPFCLLNNNVGEIAKTKFWGSIEENQIGVYLDGFLLLMMGGIPWQIYFQRVLSCRSAKTARIISYIGGLWCGLMAIAPVLIGIIARATNWSETDFDHSPESEREISMVLPLCFVHLAPRAVAYIGMAALSAGIMSSADACILSSSSQFSRNIYHYIFRPQASEREIIWTMRAGMIVFGAAATTIALTVHTVYGLWYLAADLVYVIMFPQLTCLLFLESHCNIYGSVAAFAVSLCLRLLGGEKVLGLPATIKFPFYNETEQEQLFPFKTMISLLAFVTLLTVSKIASEVRKFAARWKMSTRQNVTVADDMSENAADDKNGSNRNGKTEDSEACPRSVPMSVINWYRNNETNKTVEEFYANLNQTKL